MAATSARETEISNCRPAACITSGLVRGDGQSALGFGNASPSDPGLGLDGGFLALRWMIRRHPPSRSWLASRAGRRGVPPRWRELAAVAADIALLVAVNRAVHRVVGREELPRELLFKLSELKGAQQRGENVDPQAAREAGRELLEAVGGPRP